MCENFNSYLTTVSASASSSQNDTSGERQIVIISLLNCSEPRMVWGAIRNAQLLPLYLPAWKLRVYVDANVILSTSLPPKALDTLGESSSGSPLTSDGSRAVTTLQRLGVDVRPSGVVALHRAPVRSILDETSDLDFVLFRPADWRIGDREAATVNDWLQAAKNGGSDAAVVHCVHDNVAHAREPLVDELWGFRPDALRRLLPAESDQPEVNDRLTWSSLWPLVADAVYCHDSVPTCYEGPQAKTNACPNVVDASKEDGFVGQTYDEHHQPISGNTVTPCAKPS